MSESVLAIVLTHNAPEALARCLAGIDAQTRHPDRILVVDNGSTPPAAPGSRSIPLDLTREENTGPAGGHAVGLERFVDSDAEIAWVMDDDCIPEPECLERLLASHREDPSGGIVFPFWIDAVTGDGSFLPAWCGFVIDRAAVVRIGIPRADFVWWAEDTEYLQWRPHRDGVQVGYEKSARVLHDRVRWVDTKPTWKYYYEVRNTVFFRLYVQRKPYTRFKRMFRTLAKLFAQIVTREDDKAAKIVAYLRGVFDGLTGRLGLREALR